MQKACEMFLVAGVITTVLMYQTGGKPQKKGQTILAEVLIKALFLRTLVNKNETK